MLLLLVGWTCRVTLHAENTDMSATVTSVCRSSMVDGRGINSLVCIAEACTEWDITVGRGASDSDSDGVFGEEHDRKVK